MNKKPYIRFLFSLLAVVYLLVLPVAQAAFQPTAIHVNGTGNSTSALSQNNDEEEEEETTVSEVDFNVVIPSYHFAFGSAEFYWPQVQVSFPEIGKISTNYKEVTPVISYFEKLFEHTIAINAP